MHDAAAKFPTSNTEPAITPPEPKTPDARETFYNQVTMLAAKLESIRAAMYELSAPLGQKGHTSLAISFAIASLRMLPYEEQ